MIITILSIVLLIIGVVLMKNGSDEHSGLKEALGFILTFVNAIILLTNICFILGVQINKDIDYQNKLYEREMLEYRIENTDKNITGNEMLYNDIVEFNNSLRRTKKWSNSLWTNWFNNADIAAIDYIEIEK